MREAHDTDLEGQPLKQDGARMSICKHDIPGRLDRINAPSTTLTVPKLSLGNVLSKGNRKHLTSKKFEDALPCIHHCLTTLDKTEGWPFAPECQDCVDFLNIILSAKAIDEADHLISPAYCHTHLPDFEERCSWCIRFLAHKVGHDIRMIKYKNPGSVTSRMIASKELNARPITGTSDVQPMVSRSFLTVRKAAEKREKIRAELYQMVTADADLASNQDAVPTPGTLVTQPIAEVRHKIGDDLTVTLPSSIETDDIENLYSQIQSSPMTLPTPYTSPEAFNTGQNIVTRHGESGCRGVELTWESNPNSVFNCPTHSMTDVSRLD